MNNKIYINGRFLTQELTGVQRVASEISLHLQKHYKERLIFLYPNEEIKNSYAKKFQCVKMGFLKGHLWEQIELPLFMYKNHGDVLLNFCNTAPILFNKNIIVIHDMAVKQSHDWFDWKFVKLYNFLFFFNTKFAKKIITVSNFSKSEILKYYPKTIESKIEVIYLASFIEPREEKADKRNYFLTIGSISKRKNLSTIIKAFKKLNPNKYFLKIVGGTNKKIFDVDLPSDDLNIEYLGNVSDIELYQLIAEAKAVINASVYEGFGLPPLEAMSLNTPCILSKIPVHEELYGQTAFFFEPLNSIQLTQKIEELTNSNIYESLCIKSSQLAQNFTWEKTSKEYIKCIEYLISVSKL